jgi:hypothetical protein
MRRSRIEQQNAELRARLGGTSGALSVLAETNLWKRFHKIGGEFGFTSSILRAAGIPAGGRDVPAECGVTQIPLAPVAEDCIVRAEQQKGECMMHSPGNGGEQETL